MPRSNFEHELGSILAHFELHLGQHFRVRDLAVPDDFLFLCADQGRHSRRGLLLNIKFGDIIPAKNGEPALLELSLNHLVNELIFGLLPESELTGENSCAQLPCVDAVIDPNHQVGVIDYAEGVLDEVFIFHFVGVKYSLQLLLPCLVGHFGQ